MTPIPSPTETHYRCDATIGQEPTDWGFAPIRCGQVVATKGYWARTEPWENTGHFVAYCPKPGHHQDVERRFPPRLDLPEPPEPAWLHEDPHFNHSDDPSEGTGAARCPTCMDAFVDHAPDATAESEWAAWSEGELVAGFGK